MEKLMRIAIDGPSGAGKSTIAKELAKKFNIDYIDTGAMYRAVGYKLLEGNVNIADEAQVAEVLKDTTIDFNAGDIILDGEIINDKIRNSRIAKAASECSAMGPVREKLVELQRNMGMSKSVVMDGRDIGTNVLRNAEYKIFLTADPEERAQRRFIELKEKGQDVEFVSVLEDIKQRDHNDTTRRLNPLRKADDAVEVDTTGLNIEQVVNAITAIIEK